MSESKSFALPDVGEGLTEAEILRWLVAPGDVVEVNQMIVEIETAKAAVELPCPFAGTVTELLAESGQIVEVGSTIITIEVDDAPAAGASSRRESVLVGYGTTTAEEPQRRRRKAPPSHGLPPAERARAKPPVRRLAQELDIDLDAVPATGSRSEVTRGDLLAYAGQQSTVEHPGALRDERVAVRGVHRAMAEAMVESVARSPHVTEWVDVDMTRSMEVLGRMREEFPDIRFTPMVLVAAGLIRAVRRHPMANSSWVDTDEGPHVELHGTVNLGVASDTPRGLLVPVVRGAHTMSLHELAREIRRVVMSAREGASTPADLTGGTVTLTNIGVFGIDGGTPILSPGQTVILAMGRIIDRPWVVGGAVVPRPVMQLSISFDHRVIDGATASRTLGEVERFLTDPAVELLLEQVTDQPVASREDG